MGSKLSEYIFVGSILDERLDWVLKGSKFSFPELDIEFDLGTYVWPKKYKFRAFWKSSKFVIYEFDLGLNLLNIVHELIRLPLQKGKPNG